MESVGLAVMLFLALRSHSLLEARQTKAGEGGERDAAEGAAEPLEQFGSPLAILVNRVLER